MWIYALVFLMVSETAWSTDPGTNQSISVNSTTTKQPKAYVAKWSSFELGSNATLNCSSKTWNEILFVIWEISLKGKECKLGFNTDGKSQNSCLDGKMLLNTSESQPYLLIPNFSENDLGVYLCETVYRGGIDYFNYTVSASANGSVATNGSTGELVEGVPRPVPWLYILIGVVTCVLLVGFLIFAQNKLGLLRRCCQANSSTSKTSPTEHTEEVEPYASYMQRVNSIYNSSADFFAPKSPAHASHT